MRMFGKDGLGNLSESKEEKALMYQITAKPKRFDPVV